MSLRQWSQIQTLLWRKLNKFAPHTYKVRTIRKIICIEDLKVMADDEDKLARGCGRRECLGLQGLAGASHFTLDRNPLTWGNR